MTVLTSKLRTSIRRAVQCRGMSYTQLRRALQAIIFTDETGYSIMVAISLWPDYQREQYIRELLQ